MAHGTAWHSRNEGQVVIKVQNWVSVPALSIWQRIRQVQSLATGRLCRCGIHLKDANHLGIQGQR